MKEWLIWTTIKRWKTTYIYATDRQWKVVLIEAEKLERSH